MTSFEFGAYTFENVQSYSDNFRDTVPRTVRLPGTDGGYDIFGPEAPPVQIGNVDISFVLVAYSRSDMQAKRDAVGALVWDGWDKLKKTPTGAADTRFCVAKVNSIRMPEDRAGHSDLHQQVQVSFQVAVPFWFVNEFEASEWGEGDSWGQNVPWGGSPVSQACSGLSTDISLTNDGNAVAIPRVQVSCGGAQTCEDVSIEHIVGGSAVETVEYTGVIGNSENLYIDCRTKSVLYEAADAYDDFDFDHPDWLRLLPGSNTLRVKFKNSGDAATVYVRYLHTYR